MNKPEGVSDISGNNQRGALIEPECAFCGMDAVEFSPQQEITLNFPNPGQVVITADVHECQACGEKYLDEGAMDLVAKKIDKEKKVLA